MRRRTEFIPFHGAVEPKVEKLPDKTDDGTSIERKTFAAGKSGAPVVFYEIDGGGHTWPGGNFQPEGLLGKTTWAGQSR